LASIQFAGFGFVPRYCIAFFLIPKLKPKNSDEIWFLKNTYWKKYPRSNCEAIDIKYSRD
jgi:hypothetical protein